MNRVNIFNRSDWLILVALLCLLAGSMAYMLCRKGGDGVYAEVNVGGEIKEKVELTGHKGRECFEIVTESGRNLIVVEDESIFVSEADCPDEICVRTGRLSNPGEVAACLPHKVLIEVKTHK